MTMVPSLEDASLLASSQTRAPYDADVSHPVMDHKADNILMMLRTTFAFLSAHIVILRKSSSATDNSPNV